MLHKMYVVLDETSQFVTICYNYFFLLFKKWRTMLIMAIVGL